MSSVRPILATILPAAVAIAIASSLLIFSGSLQFALAALLAAGAAAPALLLIACTLNLRHLVMGAVLRPRIGGSRLQARSGLSRSA